MPEEIRIQHYVPRFYLRNFSTEGSNDVIHCFDKVTQRIFQVNIARIAAEEYFYDSEEDTSQSIERTLGAFESVFNEAYSNLLEHENFNSLSDDELRSLRFFIATQEVRTREFRQMISDMTKQLYQRLSGERMAPDLRRQLEDAQTESFARGIQINAITRSVPSLAGIMSEMKWVLFVNRTNLPYWTSDHPVTRFNPVDLRPYGNLGLRSPGIQIFFPLSARLSIAICDPQMYFFYPDRCETTDEQNVVFQNHLQVKASTRHVFSTNDDFSLAIQMLRDLPALGNPSRRRVSME